MQHEVTQKQDLLNENGLINEEGWARHPLWIYNRKAIKAPSLKIKEWDYYCITDSLGKWAIGVTFSDLSYASFFSISFIDFGLGKFSQTDDMKLFTKGKMNLPSNSTKEHHLTYYSDKLRISFIKKGEKRYLMFAAPNMILPDGKKGLDVNISLTQKNEDESMNITTSWKENRKAFYLNEKVNCMPVIGTVKLGDEKIELHNNDAWAVLDWGRGRWTRENRWYWSSGSGLDIEGNRFGFNLGYGFSDRTPATENVLFYNGKIHKLEDITFNIPETGYTNTWEITSSDGRFEMKFEPAVDRSALTNFGILKSDQHQVFGYFSGTAILDDGKKINLESFPAFAEDVYNKW